MKFPYSMLLDFVETTLSAEAVGDLLTMAGFELEGIEEVEGEPTLDVKVMSNRGDGLSVFGLAREVLAKDLAASAKPLYKDAANRFGGLVPGGGPGSQPAATSISIETADCSRYACSILTNVSNRDSEPWMQKRLRQAGMRPISLLVDMTNYVMLELGQPLHAFDFEKLDGGRIVVRKAREEESLTTLNGEKHKLRPDQMMICDATRPVAVAGVMGGLDTEVGEETRTVLLESAHFLNTSVRRTRKQLGLNTEASYRFERSVDPDGVVAAIVRFVQLVSQVDPGVTASAVLDQYPLKPNGTPIRLRVDRASRLLGVSIRFSEAKEYLDRLGFDASVTGDDEFTVMPPSWRPDIVREEDLIEELGRVHGYDKIPERPVEGATSLGGPQGYELWLDQVREAALRAGFSQVISHSFRDVHPLDDPTVGRVGPRNPASPEMSLLRNSLLSSLADAARRNDPKEIQIFEAGKVFGACETGHSEDLHLALMAAGPLLFSGWSRTEGAATDFFSLKGVLDSIFESVGVDLTYESPSDPDPRFHPTRQATLLAGGKPIGFMGQIHPDIAASSGLQSDSVIAELSLASAFPGRDLTLDLRTVARFPAVRRDMSILVSKSVPYSQVAQCIEKAIGGLLERQWLFDRFAGQGIPDGSHALGIAIQLRKADGTFTDEEANLVRDRAVEALAELGATMR